MNQLQNLGLFILAIIAVSSCSVTIEKGWITLETITGDVSQRHKVDLSSTLRQELNLTQSSRVKIETKITFSNDDFQPEFVAFRLRHPIYQNLTEPVLAQWDESDSLFKAVLDIGDPKQIKHMSGNYRLEVIISDDNLDKQVRKYIANVKVTFRFSLDQPLPGDLQYTKPSIILTEAPPQRVDPPQIFTAFVVILITILFAIFLLGLYYQKVNFNLFPFGDSAGLPLNLILLGCLGTILVMLFKFWINWTFIQTIQYFCIVILPVALAANYALVHVKKE